MALEKVGFDSTVRHMQSSTLSRASTVQCQRNTGGDHGSRHLQPSLAPLRLGQENTSLGQQNVSAYYSLLTGHIAHLADLGFPSPNRQLIPLSMYPHLMLRLLQLSDIHFSDTLSGRSAVDVEGAVRRMMLVDIGRMRDELGPMDGILVVGDIAARGKEAEYHIARKFLDGAAELIGCPTHRVVCVPGNHDVDRRLHDQSHEALRFHLRSLKTSDLSNKLLSLLNEDTSAGTLLSPFRAYNEFALAYGCDIGPASPVWAPKSFTLGDRSVEVHGITSAWISDGLDTYTNDSCRLVAGLFQLVPLTMHREAIHVTLCHHPPRWLRDSDELHPFQALAHIVLTGHEHETGIELSSDSRTLYVASGAVNPDRTANGWIPAYNIIELSLNPETPDILDVAIYVRSWRGREGRAEFGRDPDYSDPLREGIILADRPAEVETDGLSVPTEVTELTKPEPIDSSDHSHSHAVMRAIPNRRRKIAREMGLLPDQYNSGLDADRLLLRNAAETGKLSELAARLIGGDQHAG